METLAFVLKILGSLGVFLFGMKVMSEAMQRVAGDRMRKIMASVTGNRFSGVLTGLTTTGLIQSSSATTVMVVSFVSAGLLTLTESIGVIMGANLGTTLTAWIIAMVGKFSLAKIALPIIGIGVPLIFIGKHRARSIGEVLIGFGLLFYGLSLLKDSVPDLGSMLESTDEAASAKAAQIREWISTISGKGFFSLIVFLAIGIVLTLIVQSSSAAMAITVTITLQGWIGFHESAAIILGENIGTTVTAWLAALGASTEAKRAARAHFLFNVIGVGWMLLLFFPFAAGVDWLGDRLPDSFRTEKLDSDVGFKLAIFHTLFNFCNICLLIGFVPQIAAIARRMVRETPRETSPRLRFISTPLLDVGELNIPEAEKATQQLAGVARTMFDEFSELLQGKQPATETAAKRLRDLENDADSLCYDITEYLVRTSAAELSPENARSIGRMLRIVGELEEITDIIFRLSQILGRKFRKELSFVETTAANIDQMAAVVSESLDLILRELQTEEVSKSSIERAEELERSTDQMRKRFNKAAMKRMQANPDGLPSEMVAIEVHNQFELIANHALAIVRAAYYLTHLDEIPDRP